MNEDSPRYASRKFILTVVTLFAGAVAFGLEKFTAVEVIDLTKWVLGLYFSANVGTWLADALRTKP